MNKAKEKQKTGRKLQNPKNGNVERATNYSFRPYAGDTALLKAIPNHTELMRAAVKYIIAHGKAPEV